ncbi:TRAP transporter large permease subunit, partial [Parasedimentitalea maritima]
LLIMLNFCLVNMVMTRKFDLVLDEPLPMDKMMREAGRRTTHALPALLMPVIILGGIYGGIMTPTEAAAVAVIYAIPVGFLIYRGLTWQTFLASGKESATAVGAILIMILFSLMLSQIYVLEAIPQQLVDMIFAITDNKLILLILINLLLFFIGMIVNDITAIILTAPLLLPLMEALG